MTISVSLVTGKGYRELSAPYREYQIYGHELRSGDDWNLTFPFSLIDPTTHYDLALLTPYHEVCALFISFVASVTGTYQLVQRWYRSRDNELLFTLSSSIYTGRGNPVWWSGWIGYVPWEIWENGGYHVAVEVVGADSGVGSTSFIVTGTPYLAPLPPVLESGLVGFIDALNQVATTCFTIYAEALGWVWPFSYLSTLFFNLSAFFQIAATKMTEFQSWITEVALLVTQGLSWDSIKALILSAFPGLENLLSWASNGWMNIWNEVEVWWSGRQQTVQGWIAAATQGLSTLLGGWDTFVSTTLPQLVNFQLLTVCLGSLWAGVERFVNSAFTIREGLWRGWDVFRDQVAELFDDPEKWLLEKVESMLVRFW